MKRIAIQDAKGRSAVVFYENRSPQKRAPNNASQIRRIKSTLETNYEHLFKNTQNSAEKIAETIFEKDSEIDIEKVGLKIGHLHRFFIDSNEKPATNIYFEETIYSKSGEIKEVRPYQKKHNSISDLDCPLRWSKNYIPIQIAAKKFVVSKILQLFSFDSLTFDFLYEIAALLEEKKSIINVGAGKNGNEPIVLQEGGKPYRAFLKGKVSEPAKWCKTRKSFKLLLLLCEMEYEDF